MGYLSWVYIAYVSAWALSSFLLSLGKLYSSYPGAICTVRRVARGLDLFHQGFIVWIVAALIACFSDFVNVLSPLSVVSVWRRNR
jgi:hypothetical protein